VERHNTALDWHVHGRSRRATCMSEDAQVHIEQYNLEYERLRVKREECTELELQMMMRANQMHTIGMLVPETNPDIIFENLNLVDPASLR